ncbi:two-component system regulatory protein YycI [Brevibacillus ruminantium]|uniref:Two-component system regulatory protein YycI n=1 Tax=Brevibacillus ruminantium TaxID=2950604 RepID=A0ABY4WFC5_9BACL|nr:two-component system regulatory protein YycI [Brevibacillus ruminantium]USG65767.1 two-component system regulatory protein YycI [Brevibacillus ruminantium]
MDWSKTKTILIWAFLMLDVFLGYQVYATRGGYWQSPEAGQSEKWELEDYLRQHNVALDAEVPTETPDMTHLDAEYTGIGPIEMQEMNGVQATVEKMALAARLDPPIPIRGQITPTELLRQIGPRMMYADQYMADLYQSNQGRLLYWQMYNKLPLFVAPLEVYLADGNILGYRQTYLNIRSQGQSRPIISGYAAIRSLVEKQIIHPGERIENVSLGYYGSFDAEIQVLAPVWRIIHDGKQHFVNGFTGAQERPLVTTYFPGK